MRKRCRDCKHYVTQYGLYYCRLGQFATVAHKPNETEQKRLDKNAKDCRHFETIV